MGKQSPHTPASPRPLLSNTSSLYQGHTTAPSGVSLRGQCIALVGPPLLTLLHNEEQIFGFLLPPLPVILRSLV